MTRPKTPLYMFKFVGMEGIEGSGLIHLEQGGTMAILTSIQWAEGKHLNLNSTLFFRLVIGLFFTLYVLLLPSL
jgi:hypothetical protein